MNKSNFISYTIFVLTTLTVFYIAIIWGIINPIKNVAHAIDNNYVTASLIVKNIVQFLLKEVFASLVAVVGYGYAMSKLK